MGKVNPIRFYRDVSPAMLVAASTTSSSATLPVSILASVWPVVDVGHTACNVSGDLCGTTIIASRLNMMDPAVFNDGRTKEDLTCE